MKNPKLEETYIIQKRPSLQIKHWQRNKATSFVFLFDKMHKLIASKKTLETILHSKFHSYMQAVVSLVWQDGFSAVVAPPNKVTQFGNFPRAGLVQFHYTVWFYQEPGVRCSAEQRQEKGKAVYVANFLKNICSENLKRYQLR